MTSKLRDDRTRFGVALAFGDTPALACLNDVFAAMGIEARPVSTQVGLRRLLVTAQIDLVIIDAEFDAEGMLDRCRQLRSGSDVPIMVIVSGDRQECIVDAFDAGADDCLSSLLSLEECQARVRGLLRRSARSRSGIGQTIIFSGYRLFPHARLLQGPDHHTVALTAMEFDLLLAFCRNPGRVMSRDELLVATHSGLAGPLTRSIDVHLSRLRQKLGMGSDGAPLIKTVRLGGYVLVATVTEE